jgi:hypothetical protein
MLVKKSFHAGGPVGFGAPFSNHHGSPSFPTAAGTGRHAQGFGISPTPRMMFDTVVAASVLLWVAVALSLLFLKVEP